MPVCQLCCKMVPVVSGPDLYCSGCWSLVAIIRASNGILREHNGSLEAWSMSHLDWVKLGHLAEFRKIAASGGCETCGNPRGTGRNCPECDNLIGYEEELGRDHEYGL